MGFLRVMSFTSIQISTHLTIIISVIPIRNDCVYLLIGQIRPIFEFRKWSSPSCAGLLASSQVLESYWIGFNPNNHYNDQDLPSSVVHWAPNKLSVRRYNDVAVNAPRTSSRVSFFKNPSAEDLAWAGVSRLHASQITSPNPMPSSFNCSTALSPFSSEREPK